MCNDAIKRLACLEAFPECPLSGSSVSSISYFLPCKLICEQVNKLCPSSPDCSLFPAKDCAAYIPPGYYPLLDVQGPYEPLTGVYSFVLASWFLMTVGWIYLTFFVHPEHSVALCKFATGLPILKLLDVTLGVAFWATCNEWAMCSYWTGVAFENVHLIYETMTVMVFLLVAKGWNITRYRINVEDWRLIVLIISLFYMSLSIILVLENGVLDTVGFWIAIAIIYGIVYYFLFKNVMEQLRKLTIQVSLLEPTMPSTIIGPLLEKHRMYIILLVLIFCSFAIEITCNALIAKTGTLWKTLCVYEVANMLIFLGIGFMFRPREYSPFFFMVPARMNDVRTRAIATIEATDEDCNTEEVELAPLILPEGMISTRANGRRQAAIPNSMVLIRNPDQVVSVGISTMSSQPLITHISPNDEQYPDHERAEGCRRESRPANARR